MFTSPSLSELSMQGALRAPVDRPAPLSEGLVLLLAIVFSLPPPPAAWTHASGRGGPGKWSGLQPRRRVPFVGTFPPGVESEAGTPVNGTAWGAVYDLSSSTWLPGRGPLSLVETVELTVSGPGGACQLQASSSEERMDLLLSWTYQ